MANYKLKLVYDGTSYGGWQIQPNSLSIQEILEKAIYTILREEINIIGSGRTDAGVHALGQIANFHTPQKFDLSMFFKSLNGILPLDIRLLTIDEVDETFHARYSAKSKCYHYHICDQKVQLPFYKNYAWHIRQKINRDHLKEIIRYFIGEKDFIAFANESHRGSAAKNSVRNLYRIDIIEEENGFRLEFEGNGFLYKMVRNMVGTIKEVAVGKKEIKDIEVIFNSKDRKKAGMAAPAHGLFLASVTY